MASQAEKELQTIRGSVSELVLSSTDEMISYSTASLEEGGNDPKAPMIGACTLQPTIYLNHYTKELNAHIAEAQVKVNSMKYAVLQGLVNQPIISEGAATYAKVQAEVEALSGSWPAVKALLDTEITAFKAKVQDLVAGMKECIALATEA